MAMIAENIQSIRTRIGAACRSAGRDPESVRLMAVSKTFDAAAIRTAVTAGQTVFGENYIQEAVDKIGALREYALEWHCIGPVQSNKTRLVAEHFGWVDSIDRLKIAQRLSEQRPVHLPALQLCIQVNKAGVAPNELLALARLVAQLPRLRLRGLMSIPEPAVDFPAAKAVHARARALFELLNADGLELDTLSIGMSADLEAAIHAGSTMVRVGTAIFGGRAAPSQTVTASRDDGVA